MAKQVVIELPGIKAVSRNETTGHFIKYRSQLMRAEQWMFTYGKHKEHHFTGPVDVDVIAFYKTQNRSKCADTPNIDDKIFTDVLVRYKRRKIGSPLERNVWFIEDDNPKYLRYVRKLSVPADHYKVVIVITEVEA